MNVKLKDKKVIYIAGGIALLLIDIIVIFGWQCRSLVHNFALAGERRQQILTMEKDIINKEKYKKELSDLNTVVGTLKDSIIDESDVPVLMENISTLARTIGVKILQIKPVFEFDRNAASGVVTVNEEQFATIGIRIAAECGFHQLGAFISRLESAENFFRLAAIEIQTDTKNYLVQNVRLSLTSVIKLTQQTQAPKS